MNTVSLKQWVEELLKDNSFKGFTYKNTNFLLKIKSNDDHYMCVKVKGLNTRYSFDFNDNKDLKINDNKFVSVIDVHGDELLLKPKFLTESNSLFEKLSNNAIDTYIKSKNSKSSCCGQKRFTSDNIITIDTVGDPIIDRILSGEYTTSPNDCFTEPQQKSTFKTENLFSYCDSRSKEFTAKQLKHVSLLLSDDYKIGFQEGVMHYLIECKK